MRPRLRRLRSLRLSMPSVLLRRQKPQKRPVWQQFDVLVKALFTLTVAIVGWRFTQAEHAAARTSAVAEVLTKAAELKDADEKRVIWFALAVYGKDAARPMAQMIRYECSQPALESDSENVIRARSAAIETMVAALAQSSEAGMGVAVELLEYCDQGLSGRPTPVNYWITRIDRTRPIASGLREAGQSDPEAAVEPLTKCVTSLSKMHVETCAALLGELPSTRRNADVAQALLQGIHPNTTTWNEEAAVALGKVLTRMPTGTESYRSRLLVLRRFEKAPIGAIDFALSQRWKENDT